MPDTRSESKTTVTEQEVKKPSVTKDSTTADISTLPNLIGKVTASILTALESGSESTKGEAVRSGRRELRIWYESQPVEDRKEIAKNVRRIGEQYKQVSEQLHLDIVTLAMQDL